MKIFGRNESDEVARVIANLVAQVDGLHAQLVAATVEFERRYDEVRRDRDEMKRDRDYWREQAGANRG